MTGSTAPPGRSRHLPQLDGLRGVAVLLVMLLHSGLSIGHGGATGLDLFFVLSGFLITGVLLGEWRQRAAISLRRFYLRRVLRLYPALIVLVVVLSPLGAELGGGWHDWFKALLLTVTYTGDLIVYVPGANTNNVLHALAPTWSLAVEEQFYLVAPLLLLGVLRRGASPRRIAGGAVAAALALSAVAVLTEGAVGTLHLRPEVRFAELLLGCALALVHSTRRAAPAPPLSRALSVGSLLGAAMVAFAVSRQPALVDESPLNAAGLRLLAALGGVLLLARLATSDTALVSRILAAAPLRPTGRISYGLYLWHVPVITLLLPRLAQRGVTSYGAVAVCFAVVWTIAFLSFRFVEQPFLRMKDRLRSTPVAGLGAAGGGGATSEPAGRPGPYEVQLASLHHGSP